MAGTLEVLFGSPQFWLTAVLLIVTCVLPDLVVRAYTDLSNPVYVSIAKSRALNRSMSVSKHVSDRGCWNPLDSNKVASTSDTELQVLNYRSM